MHCEKKSQQGGEIVFNDIEFKVELLRKGKTVKDVANVVGIDAKTLYGKLAHRSEFSVRQVRLISDFLHLAPERQVEIFLPKDVRKTHKEVEYEDRRSRKNIKNA